ncbi:helix-turn-helix domain-containing protein [Haemophilus parahaemolyticus]|uniref:helix-turn-helix domain-containing protein n=1 Tax=Haemophilus parahaemolyticus TaxID=735 RepID=UPI0028E8D165|nr:HTH domain-containing protein [Haemophilus parahaemolyticus]
MDNLKPNAEIYHNPSREYISRLLTKLQQHMSTSQIAKRLGVNRSTIYNYLREETDQRFTPCPYAVQFTLEVLLKSLED